MTMPTRAMIKNVIHFVLTQLISSRMESWYVGFVGIRAIVPNGRLELRCMKHIVYMPLARQLKTEGHRTDSSNNPKRPNKLSSKLSQQPWCKLEILS